MWKSEVQRKPGLRGSLNSMGGRKPLRPTAKPIVDTEVKYSTIKPDQLAEIASWEGSST